MSNQTKGPMEVAEPKGGDARSMQDQLAKLRSDVDHLKTESKSWVKTWGVYLGMLGALIALPKGALDLMTQLWQRPDTSVEIEKITIYHDPALSSEILKFPLVVANKGNGDDVLSNNGATLTVAGQSVELSEADYGLFDDDDKKVDTTSLLAPKESLRNYNVSITFNSKTRQVAATPGRHNIQFRFLGITHQAYSASFCFPLQPSEIQELFESNQLQSETTIVQCPGQG